MTLSKIYLLNRVVLLVWTFNKSVPGLIVLNVFALYLVFKGCELFNSYNLDYTCVFETGSVCEAIGRTGYRFHLWMIDFQFIKIWINLLSLTEQIFKKPMGHVAHPCNDAQLKGLPRRWEKFGINIYRYFVDMKFYHVFSLKRQKVAIWGKNLTFKIIAIRQNGIPCCTRSRDQKTEVISTALQKLDKIFVEILFHNVY